MAASSLKRLAKKFAGVLRRRTPALYNFLITQLSSPWSRTLRNLHRLPRERRLLRENAPLFAVNIGARCGLGAVLSYCAQVLAYCDEQELSPRVLFTNPVYATIPGEDWLPRYFERLGTLKPGGDPTPLPRNRFLPQTINTTRLLQPATNRLTFDRLATLVHRSLAIQPTLTEQVNRFCQQHHIGTGTVGVHYRGTDKHLEATAVQPSLLADQVATALANGFTNIFVGTDEPSFLAMMITRFGRERVLDLDCKEIYTGGAPAHLTEGDPGTKAQEALLTLLVLSRCGLLIRTRSHLSAWSKIFVPSLPVIVHGDPFACGFPEDLIVTDYTFAVDRTGAVS